MCVLTGCSACVEPSIFGCSAYCLLHGLGSGQRSSIYGHTVAVMPLLLLLLLRFLQQVQHETRTRYDAMKSHGEEGESRTGMRHSLVAKKYSIKAGGKGRTFYEVLRTSDGDHALTIASITRTESDNEGWGGRAREA